jgi:aminoglycoside/choline kinase family phosphotransferase
VLQWANHYYGLLDNSIQGAITERDFLRAFELMGVQRHLKAAGIFCRLNHRDGKAGYLLDIPRTLSYIVELLPRHEELGFLVRLINDRCLPGLEARS